MTEQSPEEQLEHWRSELARVLKARHDLTWPNLIDWAEEAEHFASKACTKSGRVRLAGLDDQVTKLEADNALLTRELEQVREAKLAAASNRLATMERLAAAWQKEAERARRDLANHASPDDSIEFLVWSAADRPLEQVDIVAILKTIRHCRFLAAEALNACVGTWNDAEKRLRALHAPVQHMGKIWCTECSVRRSTGPRTEEWVAFIPHPCPTLETLENKEPTR